MRDSEGGQETKADRPKDPLIEGPLAEQLEKHKGQWVAVFQDKIVAVSDSAIQARDSARDNGVTDPIIFRVPTHPNRVAFL